MSADEKQMRLRYAGACRSCGTGLAASTEAIYERTTKTVRCLDCSPAPLVEPVETPGPSPVVEEDALRRSPVVEEGALRPSRNHPIDPGVPGASARREYERRHAARETRIREKHPKLGGLILALSDDPQSTTAWDTGAIGEERLGMRLNELSSDTMRVLHDRRIPGTRANIDHLAVTPTGIYVVDPKRYVDQRPTLKVEGGILRPRVERLMVGSRDRTKLVDGVLAQVAAVRGVVGDDVPITGVLCFMEADWPLIGGAFTVQRIEVLWPKKLHPRLAAAGPLGPLIEGLHSKLASALPPA